MKKKIALLMACAMTVASLAGCGGGSGSGTTNTTAAAGSETTAAANGETKAAAGGETSLVMYWWGNQVRNERTQAALDKYCELNPGISIDGQFAEWNDYWNKLATMAAGQAIPDVLQMDYMYVDQYAKSNLLVDLKPYIDNGTLDVSDISENTIASGTVDGGVYAIAAGINSPALLYNKTLLDANGITIKDNMTMDEFYALCKEIFEKTGVKTDIAYGIANSWSEYFMRSYDIVPFGDKCMNGTEADWIHFFEMYTKGLEEGWMLEPAVFAEITLGSVEQTPMVYNSTPATQSWCEFYNSNQLAAMQNAAPEGMEIGITTWPAPDPKKSGYLKSSQFFSVGVHTKNEEEAVKVLDFMINSSDANNILLGERGVPAPTDIAEEVAPQLSEIDKKVTAFINDVVTPNSSPINPPQPDGASEVYDLMNRTIEKVCYGQLDAAAAAAEFLAEANKIMAAK